MGEFGLDLVIAALPGVPERQLKGLESLGLSTVADLLQHYPRRYEDRRRFDRWPAGALPHPVCVYGQITDAMTRRFGNRSNGGYFEVRLEPVEEIALAVPIHLRWFHMPYLRKVLAAGMELVVYGQPKVIGGKVVIGHPDYEIIEPGGDAHLHMDRIVPVYPAAAGVSQRFLRGWIHRALQRIGDRPPPEILPRTLVEAVEPDLAGTDRAEAFRQIHFPDSLEAMERARRYLALEEFTAQQIQVLRGKRQIEALAGEAHCGPGHLFEDFVAGLPFPLTGAQRRCIAEIRTDLARPRPMNRLLQGDVGAGKTLVAFSAMLFAVEAGFQAALMAPTQILAEQHYLNFVRQAGAAKLDLRISLRTSDRSDDSFPGGLFGGDEPQIVVGTHALIHDKVKFSRLGLIVIDEQHKFGVDQRIKLAKQGNHPDVLVMTATPIPRTLTMTVYGDLDVSILDQLPGGRGKIITAVRPSTKTKEAVAFLRQNLEEGRQAYVVYPLVEQSEKSKSLAVTAEYEGWCQRLAGFEVGLLHGKLPPEEKDRVMARFRSGEIQVLVATTVIEVGVDVPNANLMVIYSAERFGLAQLHQLRGRVGRGEYKSYCILMVDPDQEEAMERLKLLEETRDGFRIAEEDLKLRGPGDVLGTRQSGLPDLRFAALLGDVALVQRARELAGRILDADPELEGPDHAELRARVLGRAEPVTPQVG
jgi:ATP-dependent DNA helicase RecG